MRFVGQLCLFTAFIATGYAAFACILGACGGNRRVRLTGGLAAWIGGAALSCVMAILLHGLWSDDFRFAYVADYSNRMLPRAYAMSALWVGQAGSLLLWAWLTTVLALVFRCRRSTTGGSLKETAFGVLMGFCCFLVATMVFSADPTAPSLGTPRDGVGLSPLLQHPSMLVHPPIVFLGYAAWAIPFALAIAALARGDARRYFAIEARPWALFAWAVLGGGILLGAHWAYQELGWGGYWGWDPVENGSLLPWLLGTASIHAMMAWRHRGVLKRSSCALVIATFGMCNFATFLTRSGIFSSLHAFSQSPIGWLFLVFMVMIGIGGGALILFRSESLAAEKPITSPWSRESMIAVNALAFVTLTVVVGAGTLSGTISEAITGRQIVVGTAFYNNALMPTGLLILATTALAPLLSWGGAPSPARRRALWVSLGLAATSIVISWAMGLGSPLYLGVVALTVLAVAVFAASLVIETRYGPVPGLLSGSVPFSGARRRQFGGFVVHLGVFCLALGITASSLGAARWDADPRVGQSVSWQGYRIRLIGIRQQQCPDKLIAEAELEVSNGDGSRHRLTPAQHFHRSRNEWTSEVSIHSTWAADLYTILHGAEDAAQVRLTFVHNPMVRWIWAGGWIMAAGSVVSLWPQAWVTRRRLADVTPIAEREAHRSADRDLARVPQRLRSAAVWLAIWANGTLILNVATQRMLG